MKISITGGAEFIIGSTLDGPPVRERVDRCDARVHLAAAGSRSAIQLVPYSEAFAEGFEDVHRRAPDVRKLEPAIGFRPRTPLSRIIADVVDDMRARQGAP